MGVAVADNQNSLKAGLRGPTADGRLHPAREDHPLRPRAHSRADRPCARLGGARLLRVLPGRCRRSRAPRRSPRPASARRCSCASRPSPASAARSTSPRDVRGFAVKFYTDEGNWDIVGNNIPVFFIQDAMKFPDLVHAVKPEPHNAMPQARVGARHVLGLRLADARVDAHADVGDVGPRDPAQLPDDAGLRRAHLPARQRRRRIALRASSTGSRSPARTRWSGTRRSRSTAPTPTSIAATSGKRSRPARIPE